VEEELADHYDRATVRHLQHVLVPEPRPEVRAHLGDEAVARRRVRRVGQRDVDVVPRSAMTQAVATLTAGAEQARLRVVRAEDVPDVADARSLAELTEGASVGRQARLVA